jgi:thymidylate kinase
MPGQLIVFSGLDGAGKSTQIELLREYYQKKGVESVTVWSRGGYTPGFETLKNLVRRISGKKVLPPAGRTGTRERTFRKKWIRVAWLHVALIDLIWLYAVRFRWWLRSGKIVLADRYLWDTLVDFRINFPQEKVEGWILWRTLVWLSAKPMCSYLFLVPVEESLRRSVEKAEPFPDSEQVLKRRLDEYTQLSREGHWHVLDGMQPRANLADMIRTQVVFG